MERSVKICMAVACGCSILGEKTFFAMASIKVKFQQVKDCEGRGRICYHVTHEHVTRVVDTNYELDEADWDTVRGTVSCGIPYGVMSMRHLMNCDVERLLHIIRKFDETRRAYTVDEVIAEYCRYMREYSIGGFMSVLIGRLKRNGRLRTSETYAAALNSFTRFCGAKSMMIDAINSELVEDYEAYLRGRGVVSNTVSFYMRILRAAYNRAVDEGAVCQRHPFRHVYTGVDKTTKRAIPLTVIRDIRQLSLPEGMSSVGYARDMFMMSFYLRGMAFVDMAYLRKSDLYGGYVTYRRRKTGQLLTIQWTKEMQTIVDKYPPNPTQYLLPIIRKNSGHECYSYRYMGYIINRMLKKVAELAGVQIPLTMYVARHSWASAAHASGVPLSVISEGMGHDSEATTQIYLASLDTSIVDRANSMILAALDSL